MNRLESVERLKLLRQGIEQVTGESYGDLTSAIQGLKNGYGTSSEPSGEGGIIDVTELPTSNINGNAVYRITENIQTNSTQVYVVDGTVITLQQYLSLLGVSTIANIYVVDELSTDLKPTDVQTFSQVNVYILKSDGIGYLYVPALGSCITVGYVGYQAMGYDRGFTENPYEETKWGIYTTIESYKQVERWYIRENGAWKEISAHLKYELAHGFTDAHDLTGEYSTVEEIDIKNGAVHVERMLIEDKKVPKKVYSSVDISSLIDGSIKEIPREFFVKQNGEYVTSIRPYAFSGLYGVDDIEIPNSIIEIPEGAFKWSGFDQIILPENLKTIGYESFKECHIKSISLPNSVTTIQDSAFYSCSNLTSISFPENVNIGRDVLRYCNNLISVSFPDTLTEIPMYSCYECSLLRSIKFPNSLQTIQNGAFGNCSALTEITIPDSVESINEDAFISCHNLTSVVLPKNLNRLSYSAFGQCDRLDTVTFKSKPSSIHFSAFYRSSALTTINVPWAEGEVENAPWGATNATINYNYTGG